MDRFDLILLEKKSFENRSDLAAVQRNQGSDHFPIVLSFISL
jgi:exonuclease III